MAKSQKKPGGLRPKIAIAMGRTSLGTSPLAGDRTPAALRVGARGRKSTIRTIN